MTYNFDVQSLRTQAPPFDTYFFFIGNCQIQLLTREFQRRFPGQVLSTGRAQISYDCELPAFLGPRDFHFAASQMRRRGVRSVLFVQETRMRQFARGIDDRRAAMFDSIIRLPYIHMRSIWPEFRLARPMTFTPRSVARLFAFERAEQADTFKACGADPALAEAYWDRVLGELHYYHPGHPTGPLMEMAYAPVWAAMAGAGLDAAPIRQALAASAGVTAGSMHPVDPAWCDAVGVTWHRKPAYAAWAELARLDDRTALAELDAGRRDAAALARALTEEAGRGFASFLQVEIGGRYLRLGRTAQALPHLLNACAAEPGRPPTMLAALRAALRLKDAAAAAQVLTIGAAFLQAGSAILPLVADALLPWREDPAIRAAIAALPSARAQATILTWTPRPAAPTLPDEAA